jgi:hypothetical protein
VEWWRPPLSALVAGRKVIVAGGPAVMWGQAVDTLRSVGATEALVVGTEGMGVGAPPSDAEVVVVEREDHGDDVMAALHAGIRVISDPPAHVVAAVEAFDPDRSAVVFGSFLSEAPALVGRPLVAHRRPAWVALEDKTRLADLLDRAGVARSPSVVVPLAEAAQRWRDLDEGAGTVWAADSTSGFHGGAASTRWVTDDVEAAAVSAEFHGRAATVRVMPFLDGVATSIHGIVLPDGVVALRPVELVTLRQGRRLVYAGCGTFWDPPAGVRDEMRAAARRVGEQLRADVDFRGAFTLDGVATRDGFRPTEVNPRFGAGLMVMTRGLDVPLMLVLDLVVAGRPLGVSAEWLEGELLTAADTHRDGGTWRLNVPTREPLGGRQVVYDGASWRWAVDEEQADGFGVSGGGYARLFMTPARTPIGPSIGPRAAAFWRFYDEVTDAGLGPLEAAPDVLRSSDPRLPSTRP